MATQLNLVIDQGATFSANIVARSNLNSLIPLNLIGFPLGEGEIKKSHTATSVAGVFGVDTHVSNSTGIVNISMSHEHTANLESGNYVYDVRIIGYLPGGIGPYGHANVFTSNATLNSSGFPTQEPAQIAANSADYNQVPSALSTYDVAVNNYTITNGAIANSAYSSQRPYYISAANDVSISISTEESYIGTTSLLVRGQKSQSWMPGTTGFREVIFANVEMYGANSAHVGNSYLVVSGSQHPNAIYNNTYTLTHTSNSHPLYDMHFRHWGISNLSGKRWIYSMYINPSHGGDGEGSPIRLQMYTANATHNPNTTSFFVHVASNDQPFDTGSTGPHQSGNLYASAPSGSGEWSRVSHVVDLRTTAYPNTAPDWHKDTIRGNTHVQNGLNLLGVIGRLHFRDQVDQLAYGSNALAGGYPSYSIIHDSGSWPYNNEIQYWRVGDEIGIDYVGGFTNHVEGGRTDFWGTPWSRQYRTITNINEAAPWIDLTIPGGIYGGAIRIPDATSNSTHNPEVFAQTVNLTLQTRNNERFRGANTHDTMILSFSPYFTGVGYNEYWYIDGIQLEEQANVNVTTPRPLSNNSIVNPWVSLTDINQDSQYPAVIRIAEGKITVTPAVTT